MHGQMNVNKNIYCVLQDDLHSLPICQQVGKQEPLQTMYATSVIRSKLLVRVN
jgi:hypothetical protein